MPSKESTLMRMPSDLRGLDKYNPCLGCGGNDVGYCRPKKRWAHLVKHECVTVRVSRTEPKKGRPKGAASKAKFGNVEKEVICLDTNIKYRSAAIAQQKTGVDQSSISKCCKKVQKTVKGQVWAFTGVVRHAGREV